MKPRGVQLNGTGYNMAQNPWEKALRSKATPKPAQKKSGTYPQSLSQRDQTERSMNSAYQNAVNKGTLGFGFGGQAPKSAYKK